MKKTSMGGGRPSVGIPLRVRQDNHGMSAPKSGKSTSKATGKARSLSFSRQQNPRISSFGAGASAYNRPSNDRVSYLSKTGRPSSGIGVRGRTDGPLKDSRPLMDKRYQQDCIKKLLEFLKTQGYPQPTSQKLLGSPTSKDFFKIFIFIYSKLCPGYKGVDKMEDEVQRALRMLGYPFTFSKQYLYSVGSPHTWPHLLAALIWLLDLIEATNGITDVASRVFGFGAASSEDFDKKPDDRIAFEYYGKTYAAFMEGHDTFEDLDEEIQQVLRQNLQGENIDSLREKIHRYEAELKRFGEDEDSIQKTRDEIGGWQQDIKGMQKYLVELSDFNKGLGNQLTEREEAFKILTSDLESENARLNEQHQILQMQDLSQADVDRLKAERSSLRQKVEQYEKRVEALDSEMWKISMEISRINEKVEKEVEIYNRNAIQLKLVPETAELSGGKDLRLYVGSTQDLVKQFEENVKPHLKKIKARITQENLKLKKDHFNLKCELEKHEESSNEKQESIDHKKKELERLETEINTMKQMLVSNKKSISSEVESLQDSLRQIKIEREALERAKAEVLTQQQDSQQTNQTNLEAVAKELSEIEHARNELPRILKAQIVNFKKEVAGINDRLRQRLAQERERVEKFKAQALEREKRVAEILDDPIDKALDF